MYTFGGRHEGDNKLYTFTSRPVHLLAASYLLLSPIHVRSALQAGVRKREKREYPSVSSRYMHRRPQREPEAQHIDFNSQPPTPHREARRIAAPGNKHECTEKGESDDTAWRQGFVTAGLRPHVNSENGKLVQTLLGQGLIPELHLTQHFLLGD